MIAAVMAVEDSRLSSMFVFFFIALLIVSPFGYRQIRSVMATRRELLGRTGTEPNDPSPMDGHGAAEVGPARDLATTIDAIAVAAAELAADPAGSREVDVPTDPTVEGRRADPAIVDALLDDAVRRSGLVAERTAAPDGGVRLRLVRG